MCALTYFVKSGELEKGLFNRAIVVNMDRIFEHVVQEVGVWFNVVVQ